MNKFVRTKSPTGSKFSKIFFQPLYAGWTVVVHLCCGFSLWLHMAPRESADFNRVFWSISYQFEEGQSRQLCIDLDAVSTSVTGPDVLFNALNISHIRL